MGLLPTEFAVLGQREGEEKLINCIKIKMPLKSGSYVFVHLLHFSQQNVNQLVFKSMTLVCKHILSYFSTFLVTSNLTGLLSEK